MKKIPTVFLRNWDTHKVTDEVTPGCEWVLAGEGIPTRKWDGTCVRMLDGAMWKRREVKAGKEIPPYMSVTDYDEQTGKTFGWVLADREDPNDKWIYMAHDHTRPFTNGTYEAIGPKINGNHDRTEFHELRKHGDIPIPGWNDRSYELMKKTLLRLSWEGVVFHHPDGRMAKLKGKDF